MNDDELQDAICSSRASIQAMLSGNFSNADQVS